MKKLSMPNPDKPLTSKEFNAMSWKRGLDGFAELMGEEYVAPLRKKGRPPSENPKHSVTLRLDDAVIAGFKAKAKGKGWQTLINKVLLESLA